MKYVYERTWALVDDLHDNSTGVNRQKSLKILHQKNLIAIFYANNCYNNHTN